MVAEAGGGTSLSLYLSLSPISSHSLSSSFISSHSLNSTNISCFSWCMLEVAEPRKMATTLWCGNVGMGGWWRRHEMRLSQSGCHVYFNVPMTYWIRRRVFKEHTKTRSLCCRERRRRRRRRRRSRAVPAVPAVGATPAAAGAAASAFLWLSLDNNNDCNNNNINNNNNNNNNNDNLLLVWLLLQLLLRLLVLLLLLVHLRLLALVLFQVFLVLPLHE